MKKRILLLLTLLLCLTGCGQGSGLTEALPTADPEEIAVNQEGGDYSSETDAQSFWGRDGNQGRLAAALITKGNGGYYFLDGDTSLLCFYDPETGSAYPLCASPNCSHDSESCDAWWGNYSIEQIQSVNGAIYLLGCNWIDDFYTTLLMRVQPDGSGREKIYEVLQTEADSVTSGQTLIHRGYLYYSYGSGETTGSAAVFRRRLDGQGEAEQIYESKAYYDASIDLLAYGNYLYVQESGYTDDEASAYAGTIGRISIHTLVYETVKEGNYWNFAVDDPTLYYSSGTEILARNMDTGEETVLYETGMPVYLAFDGTNLWLDNDCGIFVLGDSAPTDRRTLTVLSTDGTVLQELPIEGEHTTLLFGDGEYLFAEIPRRQSDGNDVNYVTPICAAKKSDVLSGTLEWSELYEP